MQSITAAIQVPGTTAAAPTITSGAAVTTTTTAVTAPATTAATPTTAAQEPRTSQQASTTTTPRAPAADTTETPQPASEPEPEAEATTTPEPAECFNFFADLAMHASQAFPGNPDAGTKGIALIMLCTNGTMLASSTVHGGRTQIIAVHIHIAKAPRGSHHQRGDGAKDDGPPIINFCGASLEGKQGMIDDGSPYTQECKQWVRGVAKEVDMPGLMVAKINGHVSVADRVRDIANAPASYYFNVHSDAEWTHWSPVPHGICRGPLSRQ